MPTNKNNQLWIQKKLLKDINVRFFRYLEHPCNTRVFPSYKKKHKSSSASSICDNYGVCLTIPESESSTQKKVKDRYAQQENGRMQIKGHAVNKEDAP